MRLRMASSEGEGRRSIFAREKASTSIRRSAENRLNAALVAAKGRLVADRTAQKRMRKAATAKTDVAFSLRKCRFDSFLSRANQAGIILGFVDYWQRCVLQKSLYTLYWYESKEGDVYRLTALCV